MGYSGRYGKGGRRERQADKRREAEERNAKTPPERRSMKHRPVADQPDSKPTVVTAD